jgi:bifunctional DNase/RNase
MASVRMVVAGLTVDPLSKAPIVVLRQEEGTRAIPIWIGLMEASAIAAQLEGIEPPRPMTHDLLRNAVDSLGGELKRVVVNDLRGNTFYALLELLCDGELITVDARPSDAIALALRADAPIYVDERVMAEAQPIEILEEEDASDDDQDASEDEASSEADLAAGEDQRGAASPTPLDPTTPPERWTEILEGLDPADFGKYKM